MDPYFSDDAMGFLRGLARNNNREWFERRRDLYERELKAPMTALVETLTGYMADFAPDHMRPAQKILMRIYRDVRFSSDKSPYKTHMAAWWSRAGLEKTSGGGFYLHVGAKEVTIAAGVYMPGPDQLLAIRRQLVERHEEFKRLLSEKRLQRRMQAFDGMRLKGLPKGFNAADPGVREAEDLLVCRQWGVSATLPAEAALHPTLAGEVVERFRLAAPMVAWLNEPLVGRKRSPMFLMS